MDHDSNSSGHTRKERPDFAAPHQIILESGIRILFSSFRHAHLVVGFKSSQVVLSRTGLSFDKSTKVVESYTSDAFCFLKFAGEMSDNVLR